MAGAIETVTRVRHYRTTEEKRRIVEAALASGQSVAIMARQCGVNANQLFHWRKLYQAGLLGTASCAAAKSELQLLPVAVSDEPVNESAVEPSGSGQLMGTINIELPGRALVSVEGQVDPNIVRAVLESLRG
jgi:transposase